MDADGLQTPASCHCINHHGPPREWHHGFPLGNGDLGTMVWGDGNPLAFTLDKADLWDLRSNDDYMASPDFSYAKLVELVAAGRFAEIDEIFELRQRRDNPVGPTKVSIGRAELRLGNAMQYNCRLELDSARVQGTIETKTGEVEIDCFVQRQRNVLCLRVTSCPADSRLALVPLADMNDDLATLGHPRPELREEGDVHILSQRIPDGPSYAVVWNPGGPEFFLAVESADSPAEAVRAARETWQRAATDGFDLVKAEHERAWADFWAGSGVYLPEARMEFLWYHGLYLLASAARRGSLPPGLQGLWAMDGVLPPWRGDYHADMNVQETFWPACASGHLDLLDCWCDFMQGCAPQAQAATQQFFGSEGTFWTCAFLPQYTVVSGWHTVQHNWSHAGWLAWLIWLRWRHSMDIDWLAQTGYPLVADIFRFYHANLRAEDDGYLHIPVSSSPEYKDNKPEAWCKDPTMDIALIRRCCDWIVEMEDALGQDALTAAAEDLHERLVPYHVTDGNVLCLWADKPLDESHRHPSHLMPIHPAMDITIDDDDEARAIIAASLEQFFALGQYHWAGHTYAQMVSFGAVIGRAEFAYDCLLRFVECWIGPNALHGNRDVRETGSTGYRGKDIKFTMEANCGIAAGISDMLLQGWRDIVRVFPTVPEHWCDVAFCDLLTEGAFRVSASRRNGRTAWVRVRATVPRLLQLRNPFGNGISFDVTGTELRCEGDLLLANLAAGQTVTLCAVGETVDLAAAVQCARTSDISRLGLR